MKRLVWVGLGMTLGGAVAGCDGATQFSTATRCEEVGDCSDAARPDGTGGSPSSGGMDATGGRVATGGTAATGGLEATGGSGSGGMHVVGDGGIPGAPDDGGMPQDASAACDSPVLREVTDDNGRVLESDHDTDCDGLADWCVTDAYSESNLPTRHTVDKGCDGVIDECTDVEWNAVGHIVRREERVACEGPVLECALLEYDEFARVTRTISAAGPCEGEGSSCLVSEVILPFAQGASYIDEDCDGTRDAMCTESATVSSGTEVVLSGTQIDEDCDGVPDQGCFIADRDAEGRLLLAAIDADCDKQPDSECKRYTYSDDGKVLTTSYELICGTEPVTTMTEFFDDNGALIRSEKTTETGCERRVFDAEGRVTHVQTGPSCDAPTECFEEAYDSAGRRVLSHKTDCHGVDLWCSQSVYDSQGDEIYYYDAVTCVAPESQCATWTLDAAGRLATYEHGCDEATKRCTTRTHDDQGRLTREEEGRCAGEKSCRTFVYDDEGQLVRKESGPCDAPTTCETVAYDAQGRITAKRSGPCGAPNTCEERTFGAATDDPVRIVYSNCVDAPMRCVTMALRSGTFFASIQYDDDCDGTPERCMFSTNESRPSTFEDPYQPDDWYDYVGNPTCSGFVTQGQP